MILKKGTRIRYGGKQWTLKNATEYQPSSETPFFGALTLSNGKTIHAQVMDVETVTDRFVFWCVDCGALYKRPVERCRRCHSSDIDLTV